MNAAVFMCQQSAITGNRHRSTLRQNKTYHSAAITAVQRESGSKARARRKDREAGSLDPWCKGPSDEPLRTLKAALAELGGPGKPHTPNEVAMSFFGVISMHNRFFRFGMSIVTLALTACAWQSVTPPARQAYASSAIDYSARDGGRFKSFTSFREAQEGNSPAALPL